MSGRRQVPHDTVSGTSLSVSTKRKVSFALLALATLLGIALVVASVAIAATPHLTVSP